MKIKVTMKLEIKDEDYLDEDFDREEKLKKAIIKFSEITKGNIENVKITELKE